MGTELSLAGVYRGKLVELLHHSGLGLDDAMQEYRLEQILDDDYIRAIPIDVYLLMTFMGYDSEISRNIVQVRRIFHAQEKSWGVSRDVYFISFEVYGTDTLFSEAGDKLSYYRELRCNRIIEYKTLDIADAPFFINWYWLSESIKSKLFGT